MYYRDFLTTLPPSERRQLRGSLDGGVAEARFARQRALKGGTVGETRRHLATAVELLTLTLAQLPEARAD